MEPETLFADRKMAIHLLRKGEQVAEVAQELKRSEDWVRKWSKRYRQEGYLGLQDRSRAPKKHGRKLAAEVVEKICLARMALEAERELGCRLKYIGALAVRTRLREWQLKPLPSKASIERVLSSHKLAKKQGKKVEEKVDYPHIQPKHPQELVQVDIVPHYLTGGEKLACFNAIDVVSRYPTGCAYPQQRAEDACQFLLYVWREMGIPTYTQVDNESCFSGGHSHPHVLGMVVRLALTVGTELVFSPFYHPESNHSVERFHQDYNLHVWNDTYLEDCQAVNTQADHFFQLYRQRLDHSALVDQSPTQLQGKSLRPLSPTFTGSEHPLPLRTGKVHFIRRVNNQGLIKVLNVEWAVPDFDPLKGVWVTLELQTSGATLSIYDAAPDVAQRQLLASYPFPVANPVLPWSRENVLMQTNPTPASTSLPVPPSQSPPPQPLAIVDDFVQVGLEMFQVAFNLTAQLTSKVFSTMY
jgi:transposase